MKSKQLRRLLNLIRETGDRLVIADDESENVFVLMNLDEYENLSGAGNFDDEEFDAEDFNNCDYCGHDAPIELGNNFEEIKEPKKTAEMNERELLEKINSDIADWRTAQAKQESEERADEMIEEKKFEPNASTDEEAEKSQDEIKAPSGFSGVGDVLNDEKYLNRDFDLSPRTGTVEETDLSDVPHEEEKFYLEPVE